MNTGVILLISSVVHSAVVGAVSLVKETVISSDLVVVTASGLNAVILVSTAFQAADLSPKFT